MTRTNAYSILCVFIRVFALWMFASEVIRLPVDYQAAIRYSSLDHAAQIAYGGSAFVFAVAVALWIFADLIAKSALARPQQITFDSDVQVVEWQALAFSVVGLWQVLDGMAYLTTRLARLAIVHLGDTPIGLPDDFYGWIVSDLLRMAIGIGLLFGSRGLVGLIRRFRAIGAPSSGMEKTEELE